jgi:maleylacetate reductase
MRFAFTSSPVRVVFGAGAITKIAAEAARIGHRPLVLTTPRQAALGNQVIKHLGAMNANLFNGAEMHVPVNVVDQAADKLARSCADSLIAVGGGSTIGLAKALALRTRLPILAVPTTYAGSEMTSIWGLTKDGQKSTGRDDVVRPSVVLYDPELLAPLPVKVAITSGMNAIAHCCEALYACDANPLSNLMAIEGISVLARALPRIKADANNFEARELGLYGAWLGGSVLDSVAMALHHKLCHTLGGCFNLAHAELHTALLPHVIAYNAPAAPDAMEMIAKALGSEGAASGLFDLGSKLGATMALSQVGMPADGIETAVQQAMATPYPNPQTLNSDGLRKLLINALAGHRPGSERRI